MTPDAVVEGIAMDEQQRRAGAGNLDGQLNAIYEITSHVPNLAAVHARTE
jgi:hypothetical protein